MNVTRALEAHIDLRRDGFHLDYDLHVAPGSTAALLGPNGAGKSTTIEVLAGLLAVDRAEPDRGATGYVRLGDETLDDASTGVFVPPERRRVGVVFQDHLLFDHLSVRENIAFGPRAAGIGRRRARASADEWLDRLELNELARRHPRQLSGGQAQRVALARTLAAEPDLLLFDEPLAALDVEGRRELRRFLRVHLDEFAGPRLIVTHDPADAFLLADRLHVLEAGRITQCGSPDDIRRHPATPYVATLAGTNLYAGSAADGVILLDAFDHTLTIADRTLDGPVLATVHPTAVSLHANRPEGSQRNIWPSTVELIEPLGDTVRVTLGDPLPMAVDITAGAVDALELSSGAPVWAAVKATEIGVAPT